MAQLLDGVILLDPTGVILSANAAALRMHGVSSPDELGATAEDYAGRFALFSEDGHKLQHRQYPLFRLLAGESLPDLVVQVAPANESDVRWVHQVRDVLMDIDGGEADWLALVICDVSEKFDAEIRFKAMFQANPAPAVILRLVDQRIMHANPGFLELSGFSEPDLIGRTLFGLDLLQDIPDSPKVRRQLEQGYAVPQTQASLLTKDGARRLVIFAVQPVDVTREDALLFTFADLEPWREAHEAREGSERQLFALFDMAPIAMLMTCHADGRITRVNAAFVELTGYTPDKAVHRTIREIQLWEAADDINALPAEGRKTGALRNRETEVRTEDGGSIQCLISTQDIDIASALQTLWVIQDIQERRRSDVELVEAIDEVLKDANWLSRSIVDKLAAIRRPGLHLPTADLSRREREILQLICQGLGDAAIAERLALSRNTVRNHIARLYAKIGVNRRSDAVIWGRERGMGHG